MLNICHCFIFIRFPSDTKIRKLLLTACGIRGKDFKHNLKLCSLHFEENFFKSGTVRRSLKPGSIPTKLSSRTKSYFESGYLSLVFI